MLYSDVHGAVIGVCSGFTSVRILFPCPDHLVIPPSILSKWIPGPGVFSNSVIKSVMSSSLLCSSKGVIKGSMSTPFQFCHGIVLSRRLCLVQAWCPNNVRASPWASLFRVVLSQFVRNMPTVGAGPGPTLLQFFSTSAAIPKKCSPEVLRRVHSMAKF